MVMGAENMLTKAMTQLLAKPANADHFMRFVRFFDLSWDKSEGFTLITSITNTIKSLKCQARCLFPGKCFCSLDSHSRKYLSLYFIMIYFTHCIYNRINVQRIDK